MPKPLTPSDLSDAAIAMIANRFKVLSDPLRLKLLIALEARERNVSELVAATKNTQTNVSRHLATLADAGIVTRRKAGQSAIYRISDPAVFDLCKHVCGSLQKRFEDQAKAARLFTVG
jgi:ArsR family transcriptional regulator